MARVDLLPGVSPNRCPPVVVANSRRTVVQARRRATLRDVANLALVGVVDYVALHWPATHVPFLDREQSVLLVALVNAAVVTHIVMTRVSARLAARRIAATWSNAERERFFNGGPL